MQTAQSIVEAGKTTHEMAMVNNDSNKLGVHTSSNNDKYEGNWKDDLRSGRGIKYYSNGDKYDGEWNNDLKEGKGKDYINFIGRYEYHNGNLYEGELRADMKDGNGLAYLNNPRGL